MEMPLGNIPPKITEQNAQTNIENPVSKALEVAASLKKSHDQLIEQIKNLRSKNPTLDKGLGMHGGIQTFYGFEFQTFDKGGSNFGRSNLFNKDGGSLDGFIEANKGNISVDQLEIMKAEFENRKAQIIEALSKQFASPIEDTWLRASTRFLGVKRLRRLWLEWISLGSVFLFFIFYLRYFVKGSLGILSTRLM
jgi:hypothetical protein